MCHKRLRRKAFVGILAGFMVVSGVGFVRAEHSEFIQDLPIAEDFVFSRDYLEKYFPKVFITRDFFLNMTVDEVAHALGDVVNLLADDPASYFTNPGKPFKIGHFWEHIVDQLSWTSDFIERVAVDNKTGRVVDKSVDVDIFSSSYACWQSSIDTSTQPLATKLAEHGSGTYYQFYALCFDYLKKLFNEGILLFDVQQAMHYYVELEFATQKLRGSTFEARYQEHFKEAYELMNLLKKKLGIKDDVLENASMRRRAYKHMGMH